eukprot:jgi/Chlat1/8993/Chrsp94S08340
MSYLLVEAAVQDDDLNSDMDSDAVVSEKERSGSTPRNSRKKQLPSPRMVALEVDGEPGEACSTSGSGVYDTRQLWGHPVGLYVLFATEMWERFSYYGMRALLVLFLTSDRFHSGQTGVWGFSALAWFCGYPEGGGGENGKANTEALASRIYGLYTALVYLTPLAGGVLADRYFGLRRMIVFGGAVMALGHFLMAIPSCLLLALLCLIMGEGAFKPNVSTELGLLYPPGDSRVDAAYSIFYVGINVGAFLSPLVCGALRKAYGFHAGFTAAGVGMIVSVAVYTFGRRFLPPSSQGVTRVCAKESPAAEAADASEKQGLLLSGKALDSPHVNEYNDRRLWREVKQHRRLLAAVAAVNALNVVFWAVYEQQGNSITLYTDQDIDRHIFGWEMPTEWTQSLNPLMIIAFTPVLTTFWKWQARRGLEPSDVAKMGAGSILLCVAYIVLFGSALNGLDSLMWLVLYTALLTVGELYLSPIGLALIARVAPAGMASLLMGTWCLNNFFGNYLAGLAGSLYPHMSHASFFALLSMLAGCNGALLLLASSRLKQVLQPRTTHSLPQ